MQKYEPLTDLQWEKLKDLFPVPVKRGRGKPHAPWRSVVNSILFVLLNKTKWSGCPQTEEFASKSAAHRWFVEWERNGKLTEILEIVHAVKPDCAISMPKRRLHPIRELDPEESVMIEIPLFMEREKPEPAVHAHE